MMASDTTVKLDEQNGVHYSVLSHLREMLAGDKRTSMGKQDGLQSSLSHLRAYSPEFNPYLLGVLEFKYSDVYHRPYGSKRG